MPWTSEQKLRHLMSLPWTVTVEPGSEPGERVIRISELPSVVVVGMSDDDLEREFWLSLRVSLETYLHYGDPLPLPARAKRLPWEPAPPGHDAAGDLTSGQRLVQVKSGRTEVLEPPPTELQATPQEEPCTV